MATGSEGQKPTCFIIMPISTPKEAVPSYKNDTDHFSHILEYLFKPAIEKAGLKPISPVAEGADPIHAGIITNLEQADLVFCDMSTLNANVFFELGIRTSLDKPVCLVRDTLTPKIIFDTGILNFHTYDPSTDPWVLKSETEKIADHIKASMNRSEGRNPLWRLFGLTQRAHRPVEENPIEAKLDHLINEITSLRTRPADVEQHRTPDLESTWIRVARDEGDGLLRDVLLLNPALEGEIAQGKIDIEWDTLLLGLRQLRQLREAPRTLQKDEEAPEE